MLYNTYVLECLYLESRKPCFVFIAVQNSTPRDFIFTGLSKRSN